MLRMILAVLLGLTTTLPAQTNGTVGIRSERPTSGRAIETEQGWMVPYTQTIPGCDAAFEMVPIPAGEIELKIVGSKERVTVVVEPLWVGKYEVTWAEYEQYMDECKNFRKIDNPNLLADATFVTAPTALYSPDVVYEFSPTKEHPACAMTQFAARQYTKWLSLQLKERYRLPTEAEWMYACSAGDLLQPIDAKELVKFAVCESDETGAKTVGTRKPNAWGLHDMLGNISEWVIDGQAGGQGDGSQARSPGRQSVFDAIEWTSTRYGHGAMGGNWRSRFVECSVLSKEVCSIEWWDEDPDVPTSPWWMAGGPWVSIGFRIVRPLNRGIAEEWTRYWEPDSQDLASDVEETIRGGRGIVGRPLVSPRVKKPLETKKDTKR